MKKIFHIITKFDVGGAERIAMNIAKSDSKEFEYHIVEVAQATSEYSKNFIDEAESAGIIVHRSNVKNIRLAILSFHFRLGRLINRYKPDVLHIHTEVPDLAIYISSLSPFCKLRNILIVRTIHNNQLWNSWKAVGQKVESFLQKNSTIVSISKSTQHSYYENYNVKCPIIYNGIEEVEQCIYSGIIKDKINIVFAARMEYQKGLNALINLVSHFGDDSRFHFHIFGSGSEAQKVAQHLGKYNNVTIKDRIFGLSNVIGSFDFLFMPSLFEGLALTPIEAALAGTPSIINSALGLEETMPSNWPLKVVDNDLEQYIKIFDNISSYDYVSLQRMAKDNARDNFLIKDMQKNYEKLYYEIC